MVDGSGRLHVSDRVREACAWVSSQARSVRIEEGRIAVYAADLPALSPHRPDSETELLGDDREALAAFWICLDAINFGSGWWPTIRRRPGRSGYFTVAAALTEHFRRDGPCRRPSSPGSTP